MVTNGDRIHFMMHPRVNGGLIFNGLRQTFEFIFSSVNRLSNNCIGHSSSKTAHWDDKAGRHDDFVKYK